MTTGRRELIFPTARAKAAWLAGWVIEGAELPKTRALARRFVARFRLPGERAAAIHDWIARSIIYVQDPGGEEQFADADVVLTREMGDCDDKAGLFVALCLAARLDARLRPVFDTDGEFTHVQAVVRWSGSQRHAAANRDGWIVSEEIVPGAQLGDGAEAYTGKGHFE
jgi:transglutaminase-like putative cysteine protease